MPSCCTKYNRPEPSPEFCISVGLFRPDAICVVRSSWAGSGSAKQRHAHSRILTSRSQKAKTWPCLNNYSYYAQLSGIRLRTRDSLDRPDRRQLRMLLWRVSGLLESQCIGRVIHLRWGVRAHSFVRLVPRRMHADQTKHARQQRDTVRGWQAVPGHTVGISTRRLIARHLHSLIAIFCPRQHHFRPITLVASSDDSFGIALAVCCSCEVDKRRVTRSSVHRNFGGRELILKSQSGLSDG